MKKRAICLALAFIMLAGCAVNGGNGGGESEEAEQLLETGYYAVHEDEYGAPTGYLRVQSRNLTYYDINGAETAKYSYEFDEEENVYYVDGAEDFTVEKRRKRLYIVTWDTEDEYLIEQITKDELPAPAEPDATEPATVTPPEQVTPDDPYTGTDALASEDIYRLAQPSTVEITALVSDTYYYTGTGFFDDDKGTVITNYHVIDGTFSAYITTSDGDKYDVTRVIGYDEELDIAILETEMRESTPLTRRATPVVTGETVYALGSSLGLSGTFSDGVVSSAFREYDGQYYIQHTAAISHGNSGGPLLDKYGRVMGINCAYIDGGQNLNLAIPIEMVDTVSRNVNRSLADLHGGRTYGGSDEEWGELEEGTVAVIGYHSLEAELPDEMWESAEVNESATGISTEYDGSDFILYLFTNMYETDGVTLADFDAQDFIDILDDILSDEANGYYAESTSVVINGLEWMLVLAVADYDDAYMENWLLFAVAPDGTAAALANFSILGLSEDGIDHAEDLIYSIVASMYVD